MFVVVWISFLGLFYSGCGLNHHARHERTRYVSSRNQIYGENFDEEKHIPFVHFWEKPLQVLESSMKIPKKLSSRPLFSWDLPVQISTYTPSRKTSMLDNSIKSVTESISPSKEPKPPDTESNAIPFFGKLSQRSRSDRAKASVMYPGPVAFIPRKAKKSGNRKKSIEESEKWKEFSEGKKNSAKLESDGRVQRRKKLRKNRKGKLEKTGKRRKMLGRVKEMNDQINEVRTMPEYLKKNQTILPRPEIKLTEPEVQSPCKSMEGRCEHKCKEINGEAVCVCFRGFTLEGERCVDINECETNNGGCNGKCVNTIGSRKCICSAGFRLVDGVCADINECLLRNGHGPCQDRCINTLGSYHCSCDNLPGTTLSSNKHTCEEDETCNITTAGCSHSCINLSGRGFCTCPDGFELGSDWKTCHDIDECLNPEDNDVRCEFGCVNTLGSYACADENFTSTIGGK